MISFADMPELEKDLAFEFWQKLGLRCFVIIIAHEPDQRIF